MEPSAIGTAVTASTPPKRFDTLTNEDFFALLIAELQSQDPLNPTDNQQLFAQVSQIRQIEQSVTLNDTLQALAGEQRFGATSALIGHYVSGTLTDQSGTPVEVRGVVIGVRFERDGSAILELHDGSSLPAEKVDQVTLVENLPPEIREQLEAGLAPGVPGEGDGSGTGSGESAAAKSIAAARARSPAPSAGAPFGRIGQAADTTASIWESVFARGPSAGA